eukprot:408216-Rhodomonas_salina.2
MCVQRSPHPDTLNDSMLLDREGVHTTAWRRRRRLRGAARLARGAAPAAAGGESPRRPWSPQPKLPSRLPRAAHLRHAPSRRGPRLKTRLDHHVPVPSVPPAFWERPSNKAAVDPYPRLGTSASTIKGNEGALYSQLRTKQHLTAGFDTRCILFPTLGLLFALARLLSLLCILGCQKQHIGTHELTAACRKKKRLSSRFLRVLHRRQHLLLVQAQRLAQQLCRQASSFASKTKTAEIPRSSHKRIQPA